MRSAIRLILLIFPCWLNGQVFMRPMDHAAALSLGGSTVAYPGTALGLVHDAIPGFGTRAGILIGSAVPYGIGGWQTARIQGFLRTGTNDGFGVDIAHSGIESYLEQRFRFSYGRRLSAGLLLGGSADVLRVSAQEYGSATGVAFNLSVLANPFSDVWFGAQIQNPVQVEIAGAVVPAVLRLGAAWRASATLILLAETEKDLERPAQMKVGVEYRPVASVVLRTGLRTEPARPGLGAGLRIAGGFELNMGGEWHPTLGLTPAAMLVWRQE